MRIYNEGSDGLLAAGALAPQCVLYNFTQPISKMGCGNVRAHFGRNLSDLKSERGLEAMRRRYLRQSANMG